MHPRLPLTLSRLQSAREGAERDDAWAEFLKEHSGVVLHTCRSVLREYDAAMDAYAFALQALREDDCRRLRSYVPAEQTKFTTWLVVVTRRLVHDHLRQKYGRPRSDDHTRRAEHATRKRLEDLVAHEIEPDQLAGTKSGHADASIRREQLAAALRRVIAALDPADRLLLALRFADDRPVRDIARVLHFPSVFHVYRRLGVVLSQVREALARLGVREAEP